MTIRTLLNSSNTVVNIITADCDILTASAVGVRLAAYEQALVAYRAAIERGEEADEPVLAPYWEIPEGHTVGPEGGSIGQTWNGTAYADPAPPPAKVPEKVTNFQAQAIMRNSFVPDGRSLWTVARETLLAAKAATAGLPESDPQRIDAEIAFLAFEQANDFYRNSPFIARFAALVWPDKTPEERSGLLDQFFIAASKVQ